MNDTRRSILALSGYSASAMLFPAAVKAQSYPTRPVRIITANAAGGATDIDARLIAQWLGEHLGQSFIVENRPGGGNNVGTEVVIRSAPDGYTLQLANSVNVINTSLYEKLSFDFAADITPIIAFTRSPLLMVVSPNLPVRTVSEFLAYAKAHANSVAMGSGGVGSTGHVAGELFRMMSGIDMVHVPYPGEGPVLVDVLAGQVQVTFVTAASAISYVKAGTLIALGSGSTGRLDSLPGIPPIGDDLPGYEASSWNGVIGPKGIPAEIVALLNDQINAALRDMTFAGRLKDMGAMPLGGSPAEFKKLIDDETEKWRRVVKFSGAKVQ